MDKTYPPEAWKRLGAVLEARRGQLGYGFRRREQFLQDRGGPPPSVKTLARLERGERASYPPATVARLESLYGYAPGSIDAILAGRDPVPLDEPAAPSRPPAVPLSGSGALRVSAGLETLAREAEILFPGDRVKQGIWMFPGDPSKQAIWRTEESLQTKGEIFDLLDRKRGTVPPARGEPAAG